MKKTRLVALFLCLSAFCGGEVFAQAICPNYSNQAEVISDATHRIALKDQCKLLVITASGATITVPPVGSGGDFLAGYTVRIFNHTGSAITLFGTINGTVNLGLAAEATIDLYNDGQFWYAATTGAGAVVISAANPTATAGPVAVNGTALTYLRSDGAPAIQIGSASQKGIVQVDGTTIVATGGVITAAAGGSPPPLPGSATATAGPTAVTGSALTYMRSDAAPAVQKGSDAQFGLVEVDGTTITAAGGVITAAAGSSPPPSSANPSATAGPTVINGSASTYMRSDAAPAIQVGSDIQKGLLQVDGTSILATSGVISAVALSAANPSATAKDTAVNGVASTFMRSDAAPTVQKATSGQFGLVEVDGTTITASGGVITAAAGSSPPPSSANPSATAGPTAINGAASTYMRSDAAPAVQQGSASQKGLLQVDGTTITAASGVISATATTTSPGGTTGAIQYNNGSSFGGSVITGLVLGAGTSAPSAYSGTICTNQFIRSLSASAAATCNTVANADLANSTISGIALGGTLAALTATDATLTFSGSYTGATARTVGINLANPNTWSGAQTFGETSGASVETSATTYTIPSCGKTYIFTAGSAITVTIPASLAPASGTICPFAVIQQGAGTVSLTGSAVSAATRVSRPGYSATAGQYAVVGVSLTTISAVATANITGDGQ